MCLARRIDELNAQVSPCRAGVQDRSATIAGILLDFSVPMSMFIEPPEHSIYLSILLGTLLRREINIRMIGQFLGRWLPFLATEQTPDACAAISDVVDRVLVPAQRASDPASPEPGPVERSLDEPP